MDTPSQQVSRRDRVPYPPNPNTRKPKLELPPGSWDCHFHAYGPPHIFPYSDKRPRTPPAAPIEHYWGVAEMLGFQRGVTVQSSIMGNVDIRVTLDAIARSDGRLRGMLLSNPDYDADDIRKLHDFGIRAMRINMAKSIDGSFDQAHFDRIVSLAQIKSWSIALHLDPETLLQVAEVIRKVPVPTVIENHVQLDARLGVDQPALRTLLDLAKLPHVWIKTASAYKMIWRGSTYEQVVPVARAVAAAAPDRVIWGSDWPHSGAYRPGMMPNDTDLVDWLLDFVPDPEARRKMLVDNPQKLYDFA